MRRSRFAFAVSTCVALSAFPANAQDVATSAALFDKGVADMQAGHFDTACPTLAESLRLDDRPGTLFTLAECYAKAGKTASAVARYQEYLNRFGRMTPEEQSKQQGRDQVAQTQKDKLGPSVPMLTVKLPEGSPAGTEVKRDGAALAAVSLGLPLPVDPGDHTVTTQEPGGPVSTQTIKIADGEKKEVMLTVLPPGASPAPGSGSTTGSTPSTAPDDSSRGSGQRIAGIVVGSVGVASLLVGAITGGLTLGKKSTITTNCDSKTKTCNKTGFDAMNSAKTTGIVSSATFVVGGVATAAGIVVYFTAPKASASAPATHVGLRLSPAELSLSGEF